MKSLIIKTFILFFISVMLSQLAAQTTGLNVIIQDECGLIYTKNAKVVLRVGLNRVAIDSVSTPPYKFTNLQDNTVHFVTIEVEGNPNPDFGLRDIATIQQYILGFNYNKSSVAYVSDLNKDGRVTAADMISLQQWIFNKSLFLGPKWVFAPEFQSFAQPVNLLELVVTPRANVTTDLKVKVLKKGEAAIATGEYCNNKCPDDPTMAALIFTDSLILEKDVEYQIPFYAKSNKGFFGIASVIDFKDGEVVSISGQSRVNETKTQLNLLFTDLSTRNVPPLTSQLITTVIFRPSRSGNVDDFFSLAPNGFLQEVIRYSGDCFVRGTGINFNMFANPVTDCVITWPPDLTLPNCTDIYLSGTPQVSDICAKQIKFFYEDSGNPCNQIQRNWQALDWSTGKTKNYTQLVDYDEKYPTVCYPDYVVNLVGGDAAVFARQLAFSIGNTSKFSFSVSDLTDTIRTIKPSFKAFEDFVIYNLEDKTSCVARVIINNCIAQPSAIAIVDEVTVPNNSGYLVRGASFDFGSKNDCTPIRDFQLSEDDVNYAKFIIYESSKSGEKVSLFLRYREGNTWIKYGKVTAILKEVANSSVTLQLPETKLEAFHTYTIGITPYGFEKILSFQVGIVFKNITRDVEVIAGSFPIKGNSYFYNSTEQALNIVWFNANLGSLSLPVTEPMIFVKLVPSKDGLLSDFIVQSTKLPGTGIKKINEEEVVDIDLIIGKKQLSTDVADINKGGNTSYYYPNPVIAGQQLYIHHPTIDYIRNIEIFDNKGIKIYTFSADKILKSEASEYSITLDESLKGGLYFMRLNGSERTYVWKLQVL